MLLNRFGDYDVIVVEATVAGVTAAIRLANEGKRVALVTTGTSPLTEFTSCLGAVLSCAETEALPAELAGCFRADERTMYGLRAGFPQARVAEAAEDALLDAGVALFYDACPGGVIVASESSGSDSSVTGVAFGGKFGVAVATAKAVIDCTPGALVARAAGGLGKNRSTGTIEQTSIFLHTETDHISPEWLDIDDSVRMRFSGHLVEVRIADAGEANAIPPADDDSLISARRHRAIREMLIRLSSDWATHHPGIRFTIRRIADELLFVGTTFVSCTSEAGVYLLSVAGDPRDDAGSYLDDRTRYIADVPTVVARVLDAIGHSYESHTHGTAAPLTIRTAHRTINSAEPNGGPTGSIAPVHLGLSDAAHDDPRCDQVEAEFAALPVIREADVLVCGLGTSGAEAARSAAEHGLAPVCFEKRADVGGVNTVGGVPAYWYGRRTPFFKRWYRALKERMRALNIPTALALYEAARACGAEINIKTPVCGVEIAGERVVGVVCIGDDGFCLARGAAVIDSSSDGDIAAWAGARYTYGAERDEITFWCSFGQFIHGKYEASRQYQSVVDQRSIHDTARGAIAGRRMNGVYGRGEFIQDYLVSRESRHITGGTVVTYHDVMAGRVFPDTVLRCKSNVDIKGMAASRAVMCGYVEESFLRNFVMSIPYSALTPVTLANVLVVGKAYSITHDGFAMARMQPDLIQLGTVAGIAIAVARHTRADSLHRVNVEQLQARLFDEGLLLPGDLPAGPDDERIPPETEEALIDLVDRAVACPPEPDEWARLFMAGERAVGRLRSARQDVEWLRPTTAQLLCALGDRSESEVLLREVDSLIEDGLPSVAGRRRHEMPDHGWAPRPVNLLCALAECGELRLVPRLERIADLLELDRTVSDHRFNYVHVFAYVGERLACADIIPVIRRVAGNPAIRNSRIPRGADARLTKDYIGERYAYLELCLARSLARCGDPDGYRTVIDYTEEVRLYLARSARAELCDLAGVDYGFDRSGWCDWLETAAAAGLAPKPYTTRHA
ncbi:MAG: FAD-dependent oxidoreductase [Spirochaetaceae bacterium]|nr:MAG: FAD-dependent oxidoreductase [Spirochaetaceae bacterium]